jgi:hypothetical protein
MTGEWAFAYYSETLKGKEGYKELYDELSKLPTGKLFEEFEKVFDGESIKDYTKYEVIQGLVADRFSLVPRGVLGALLWEEFKADRDRISELESQFKGHRHNLDKTYSEKPVW